MQRSALKRKWLLQGGIAAVLTGAGLCGAIEAGFLRHSGAPVEQWIFWGTIALSVFMSGLALMIDSVRLRILMDAAEKRA